MHIQRRKRGAQRQRPQLDHVKAQRIGECSTCPVTIFQMYNLHFLCTCAVQAEGKVQESYIVHVIVHFFFFFYIFW